jgi:dTDP-4-amino-4,6-dideoxygalactose transaminase
MRGLELSGSNGTRALVRTARAFGRMLARRAKSDWVHVGTQRFVGVDAHLLMSPVSRRIVAAQDWQQIVRTRRRNYLLLQDLLRDLAPPVFDVLPDGVCPLFYPFATRHKQALWARLRSRGVQAVLFWMTTDVGPSRGQFPEVDELRATVLELPCHQDMTPKGIERVARTVRESLQDLGV